MEIIRLHPDDGKHVPCDVLACIDTTVKFEAKDSEPRKVAPDAIRDPNHIRIIKEWYIGNGKYRDNLIFTMGISCGLRGSDLAKLKVGHLIGFDKSNKPVYRDEFYLTEQKTGKRRRVFVTDEIIKAANLYFSSCAGKRELDLNSFLFVSESTKKKDYSKVCKGAWDSKRGEYRIREAGCGMSVDSFSDILAKAVKALELPYHVASHTMRKTFGYQFLLNYRDEFGNKNTEKALTILQRELNHSDVKQTLRYIGITENEVRDTCNRMYGTSEKKPYNVEIVKAC